MKMRHRRLSHNIDMSYVSKLRLWRAGATKLINDLQHHRTTSEPRAVLLDAEINAILAHNGCETTVPVITPDCVTVKFICKKVKDDEVVDMFDNVLDAKALLLKHVKQKKAKLYVVNSLTGESVLFNDEESV